MRGGQKRQDRASGPGTLLLVRNTKAHLLVRATNARAQTPPCQSNITLASTISSHDRLGAAGRLADKTSRPYNRVIPVRDRPHLRDRCNAQVSKYGVVARSVVRCLPRSRRMPPGILPGDRSRPGRPPNHRLTPNRAGRARPKLRHPIHRLHGRRARQVHSGGADDPGPLLGRSGGAIRRRLLDQNPRLELPGNESERAPHHHRWRQSLARRPRGHQPARGSTHRGHEGWCCFHLWLAWLERGYSRNHDSRVTVKLPPASRGEGRASSATSGGRSREHRMVLSEWM